MSPAGYPKATEIKEMSRQVRAGEPETPGSSNQVLHRRPNQVRALDPVRRSAANRNVNPVWSALSASVQPSRAEGFALRAGGADYRVRLHRPGELFELLLQAWKCEVDLFDARGGNPGFVVGDAITMLDEEGGKEFG